jgi:hypothetical protein
MPKTKLAPDNAYEDDVMQGDNQPQVAFLSADERVQAMRASLAQDGYAVSSAEATAMVMLLEQAGDLRPSISRVADVILWYLHHDHSDLGRRSVLEAMGAAYGVEGWDALSARLREPVSVGLQPLAGDGSLTQHLRISWVQRNDMLEALRAVLRIHSGDLGGLLVDYGSPDVSKPERGINDYGISAQQRHANAARAIAHLTGVSRSLRSALAEEETPPLAMARLERLSSRLEGTRMSSAAGVVLQMSVAERDDLIEAVDNHCRVLIGQMHGVADVMRLHRLKWNTSQQDVEGELGQVHTLLTGMPTSASWGIGSPAIRDCARVLYDIHQVLRFQAAQDRGMEDFTTWRSPPMRFSTTQELAVLSVVVEPLQSDVPASYL